jgi:hypothetical protein
LGWARDGRDSALVPTKGTYQRLNADLSLAGDVRYFRSNYQYQQYFPLSKKYTLALNADLGWGQGLNGQPFPIFKNFYVGGLGSVRGFEQSTLGPSRVTSNSALVLGWPEENGFECRIHGALPRRWQRQEPCVCLASQTSGGPLARTKKSHSVIACVSRYRFELDLSDGSSALLVCDAHSQRDKR